VEVVDSRSNGASRADRNAMADHIENMQKQLEDAASWSIGLHSEAELREILGAAAEVREIVPGAAESTVDFPKIQVPPSPHPAAPAMETMQLLS
jgi:hypothetical protein